MDACLTLVRNDQEDGVPWNLPEDSKSCTVWWLIESTSSRRGDWFAVVHGDERGSP